MPEDEIHQRSLRRRLSDTPEKKEAVRRIIDGRRTEQQRLGGVAGGDGAESVSFRLCNLHVLYVPCYIMCMHLLDTPVLSLSKRTKTLTDSAP